MADAFDFVKNEGGVDSDESYPYEAKAETCRFKKDKVVITDGGSAFLPSGDEERLKQVVSKFGPVAVAIDASSDAFRHYKGGVYYDTECSNSVLNLDHAVLVVGYSTDSKQGDYWIVKNSWGAEKWGEQGYIRMARNRDNHCGIATAVIIPTF